jgi:pimeloyl-ACP methyl ester carboxylesterase
VGPGDHRLYVQSVGAAVAAPAETVLLLHGFPESSFSWSRNVDALARRFRRVVALDLLGFGLSDKPLDHSYSLFEQADLVLEAWRQLGVTGGHVIAHDMGDSVLTELLARGIRGLLPAWLSGGFVSVTFTDGSMVMHLAKLRVGQRLLRTRLGPTLGRLGSHRTFTQQVRSASGGPIAQHDIDMMWALLRHRDGHLVQHRIIRYIDERLRFQDTRWLPAVAATTVPIHLCWGALDRVAPPAIAQHLKAHVCPSARLTLLPRAGHFCQQEDRRPGTKRSCACTTRSPTRAARARCRWPSWARRAIAPTRGPSPTRPRGTRSVRRRWSPW